jgi:hypothetical protein
MAYGAAFCLDHRMLIDKGAGSFGMAFRADCVLIRCGLELRGLESAVRIVAIAALHQTFIYFVMEGLVKRRFQVSMAGVAKVRLRGFQQARFFLKSVNAVATGATYHRFAVRGAFEIRMRRCMAAEACLVDLLRRCLGETEDFGYVTATFDVLSPRPVAAFASYAFAAMQQRQMRMRISGKFVCYFFMTRKTGLGTHMIRGFIPAFSLRLRSLRV